MMLSVSRMFHIEKNKIILIETTYYLYFSISCLIFLQAYVSCPYGVSSAGLVLMGGSISLAIGSFSSGALLGKLGRIPTSFIGTT